MPVAGNSTREPVSRRVLGGAAAWVVLTVLSFLTDPVLGTAVLVFGGSLVVVGYLASTWDSRSSFEERELARARRRAEARLANKDKRAQERARYQAAQARKDKRAAR